MLPNRARSEKSKSRTLEILRNFDDSAKFLSKPTNIEPGRKDGVPSRRDSRSVSSAGVEITEYRHEIFHIDPELSLSRRLADETNGIFST